MARKPEQLLYDALRKAAAPHGAWLWLQRIENTAGEGIPDVVAFSGSDPGWRLGVPCQSWSARVVWIENKAVVTLPKRAATRILGDKGLNKDQIAWHMKCASHGGESVVLIRVAAVQWFAIPGRYAEFVNEWSLEQLANSTVANSLSEFIDYLKGKL